MRSCDQCTQENQCEHAQILLLHVFLLACRSIKTFNQRLKALLMSLVLMEGVLSLLVMFLVKLECDFCCPPYHPSLLLYPAAAQVQLVAFHFWWVGIVPPYLPLLPTAGFACPCASENGLHIPLMACGAAHLGCLHPSLGANTGWCLTWAKCGNTGA